MVIPWKMDTTCHVKKKVQLIAKIKVSAMDDIATMDSMRCVFLHGQIVLGCCILCFILYMQSYEYKSLFLTFWQKNEAIRNKC